MPIIESLSDKVLHRGCSITMSYQLLMMHTCRTCLIHDTKATIPYTGTIQGCSITVSYQLLVMHTCRTCLIHDTKAACQAKTGVVWKLFKCTIFYF